MSANKMKTKRAVTKRFKKTANGKMQFKKSKLRHHLEKRSSSSKRKCRRPAMASSANMGDIYRALCV